MHIDDFRDNVLKINSMLVNNEEVHLYIDGNYKINHQGFTLYDEKTDLDKVRNLVIVTNKKDINQILNKNIENLNEKIIKVTPKDIVIGVGCKKNTNSDHMKNSLIKFLSEYNIDICDIYKPPYNFVRTGCKGCPFALNLQEELDTLEKYFPNERKQCEIIWKPVYDEYRRIGYRLKPIEEERDE